MVVSLTRKMVTATLQDIIQPGCKVISLTRKMVTATESKIQASRIGLPRPTCGVCVAYAKNSYRYGIKGTGLSCRATASNLWCLRRLREKKLPLRKQRHWSVVSGYRGHPAAAPTHPPGGGGVCTGRSGRASARWRALPRRAPTHNALRRPPWRARQPRLRRSVGVGRGRGLVAVYGLFPSIWLLSGFGSPHA